MLRHHYKLIVFILVALCSSYAHAEVYKWVDNKGNVTFSDHPPTTESASEIVDPNIIIPSNTQQQEQQKEVNDLISQQQKQAEESKKQQAENEKKYKEAESRARNCRQAQSQLQALNDYGRIVEYEKGQRKYLTVQERNQRIQSAQQQVDKYCNPTQ